MKTAVNNEPNQNPGFAKNRTQPEPYVCRKRNEHEHEHEPIV